VYNFSFTVYSEKYADPAHFGISYGSLSRSETVSAKMLGLRKILPLIYHIVYQDMMISRESSCDNSCEINIIRKDEEKFRYSRKIPPSEKPALLSEFMLICRCLRILSSLYLRIIPEPTARSAVPGVNPGRGY
jgi:hypothetical protein